MWVRYRPPWAIGLSTLVALAVNKGPPSLTTETPLTQGAAQRGCTCARRASLRLTKWPVWITHTEADLAPKTPEDQ